MEQVNFVVGASERVTGLSNYGVALASCFEGQLNLKKIVIRSHVPQIISTPLHMLCGVNLDGMFSNVPWRVNLPKKGITHFTSQQQTLCLNYVKRKAVVTVHDLIPLIIPLHRSGIARKLYQLAVRGATKASHIITVSEYTKKDVMRLTGYPEEKITAIREGVDHSFFKPLAIKKDPFTILYVGSEMPHKNVATLIRAFAEVKKQFKDAKLVKVGLPQWSGARIKLLQLAKKLGISESIVWKDYVDNIAEEYNCASAFVFPSKYEGFGFPPLEAMACGCPVICSNATSLPEVVGDAAVSFNPENVFELSEKIITLLKSTSLQNKYARRGLERSKQFTWEKCAEETIKVYQNL